MKKIQTAPLIFLYFLLFLPLSTKLLAQSNTFYYVTYGGDSYKAEIVKSYTPGDNKPQIRFRHTRMSSGGSHYEDFIDYVSDTGERWRATLIYDYGNKTLRFRHCKFNDLKTCHFDYIMNFKDNSGCSYQIGLINTSENNLNSSDKLIQFNQRLLKCPPKPNESVSKTTGSGSAGFGGSSSSLRYTVRKSGTDLIMTLSTNARLLIHADNDFSPGIVMDKNAGDEIVIKRGQWVQAYILSNGNYVWSTLTDVYNR